MAALPSCVCVFSMSVFLLCPFPCLFCLPACGHGLLSTGSSQVDPIFNQLPLKAVGSLLLAARSFRQSLWLFAPWLSSLSFCCYILWLACVANLSVPLLLCSRLPCHCRTLCLLLFCLPVDSACTLSSPAFPCLESMLGKTGLTTPRHLHPRHSWWF